MSNATSCLMKEDLLHEEGDHDEQGIQVETGSDQGCRRDEPHDPASMAHMSTTVRSKLEHRSFRAALFG